MYTPRLFVFALLLAITLRPAAAEAVSADTVVSLSWDGTYETDLSGVPGAPDYVDWSKAYVPFAKLHFSAASACTDFDAADIVEWDAQFEGGTTYYVANKTGEKSTSTATNASISYDQYVEPGAAYLFSGYSRCDGAQPLTWDSAMYYSQVVEVPPVIARAQLQSPQTGRYFNKLKAGESFKVKIEEYTPRDYSSAQFDPRVFVVFEGAGIAKTEVEITDRTKNEIEGIQPTQTGTLTVKVKVQNYLYYRDDWHNVNDDWDDYDWEAKVPAPDYQTTLLSTDVTCDHVFDGVQCPHYGEPVFRAVPYTLESAPLEIPVESTWCLIQDRADSNNHMDLAEGCNSCSDHYNANANWWEDACSTETTDPPDDSLPGGLGCAAAGTGLSLWWLGVVLLPAVRRGRAR